MLNLKEKKGFIIITTFMVAGVLFVLSSAYVTGSLVQNQAVQRQKASLQAFYLAERGIEYAFVESQNSAWNWVTHVVDNTDTDADGDKTELMTTASPMITLKNKINSTTGCYEIPTALGIIEIKAYADPNKPSETIVLSRNTTDSIPRIIKYRISRTSLYQYFLFFPATRKFGSETYDGKGFGGIHVNGNIVLTGTKFNNISELSASGYIYYYNYKYRPPYALDDMDGKRDGLAPMWKLPYPPFNYYLPGDMNREINYFFSTGAAINGVPIPKELDAQWQWDKYWGTDAAKNPYNPYTKKYEPEQPVVIVVPQVELDRVGAKNANEYWAEVYGASPGWVNPEWWEDKVYGDDRSGGIETATVKFTNSQYQVDAWKEFIKEKGLESIVKEKNTGGSYLTPLKIEAEYSSIAKSSGFYVGTDSSGSVEMFLNGEKISSLPCWLEDNIQFFNAVRPTIKDGKPVMENVIQMDISKLLETCPALKPYNNIIYVSHKNLRIVNAQKLPEGGLTVVSPYNIYIKGNYNTDSSWQPSAVITNSLVYTLSESFNDPQTMPLPYKYKEYPYSLEFQEFIDKYVVPIYPKDFPHPAEGLNPHWIKTQLSGSQQLILLNSGEAEYYKINQDSMTNPVTKETTYNVAITAPFNPYPDILERWDANAKRIIEGAFIQLEKIWSNIRDVPAGYKSGIKGWIYYVRGSTNQYNYEEEFATPQGTPPGDFFAGSKSRWEETSDFNHHTS